MYKNNKVIRWCLLTMMLFASATQADSTSGTATLTKIPFYFHTSMSSLPVINSQSILDTTKQAGHVSGINGLPFVHEYMGTTSINDCGYGQNVIVYTGTYHTNTDRYMELLHTNQYGQFCQDGTWVLKLYALHPSTGFQGYCTRQTDCLNSQQTLVVGVPIRTVMNRAFLWSKQGSVYPVGGICSTNQIWDSLNQIKYAYFQNPYFNAGRLVCPEELRTIATYTGYANKPVHGLMAWYNPDPNQWYTWSPSISADVVGGGFSALRTYSVGIGFTAMYANNRLSPINVQHQNCWDFPGAGTQVPGGSSTHKAQAGGYADTPLSPSMVDTAQCWFDHRSWSHMPRSYTTPSIAYDRNHNIWYMLTMQPNKFHWGYYAYLGSRPEYHLYRSTNKINWTKIAGAEQLNMDFDGAVISYSHTTNQLVFMFQPPLSWNGGGAHFSHLTHAEASTCSDCTSMIQNRAIHSWPHPGSTTNDQNKNQMVNRSSMTCDGNNECRVAWTSDENPHALRTAVAIPNQGGTWGFPGQGSEVISNNPGTSYWPIALGVVGPGSTNSGTTLFAVLGDGWNLYQSYRWSNGYWTYWYQIPNYWGDIKTGAPTIQLVNWPSNGTAPYDSWEWNIIYPYN